MPSQRGWFSCFSSHPPQEKGPAEAQSVVMGEIPPPGSALVRPTGGQQQVCEAEVQHPPILVNHLAIEKIRGAAGSVQCLEDAGQGGQAASVPG